MARFLEWPGVFSSAPERHSAGEDAQGIAVSIMVAALAVTIFETLGLVTGGIAGLALVAHYLTGLSIGTLFFVLNLPFYALAVLRMGWAFTVKTFLAVAVFSVFVEVQAGLYAFERIQPVYGAVLGGILLGYGLLGMFRHRASLGGVGILAIYLQDRFGWRAGLVQLVYDVALFVVAAFILEPRAVALSLLSAVVLNLLLAINHRPDRYIAR